jgi:hypothetical protein
MARKKGKKNSSKLLVEKPEGNRPLRRWEDNIKLDRKEI